MFKQHGYYSHDLTRKLRFIVLNTGLYRDPGEAYDTDLPGDMSDPEVHDPGQQLEFLQGQLITARRKGQKVVVLMHKPVMISSETMDYFFTERHSVAISAMLYENSDIISAILAGGGHRDEFRLIDPESFSFSRGEEETDDSQAPPGVSMLCHPSLSPLKKTVPSFRVLNLSEFGEVIDYAQWSFLPGSVRRGGNVVSTKRSFRSSAGNDPGGTSQAAPSSSQEQLLFHTERYSLDYIFSREYGRFISPPEEVAIGFPSDRDQPGQPWCDFETLSLLYDRILKSKESYETYEGHILGTRLLASATQYCSARAVDSLAYESCMRVMSAPRR